MSLIQNYFTEIKKLLETIEDKQNDVLQKAAEKISESIENEGIIHLFGCGHSHMIGEELFYRAGGLAQVNPILVEDLMLHRGAVNSSTLERTNGMAQTFMVNIDIQAKDVLIVSSTSGRNPVPIDVAQIAKEHGAFVIAITSPRYAETQSSRHKNGLFLFEAADLVIDNCIQLGDFLLQEEKSNLAFAPGSTIAGMTIVNSLVAGAVDILLQKGITPPIFKSGNVDGADDDNRLLVDKYKKRIPLLEL
ncbi:SIS domain-containing protein [Metabacillus arenae]|uniref:UPF0309 protein IC621_08625 n=1 Tax=Metabacillus arenae TaxID=2771434 RepID=A0A926NLM1_9BACI|nr:SIS domain-containing protein [Metabacillus arenae]MBD1380292.1 SIS domain-containing protein [Metabacillus arenae]